MKLAATRHLVKSVAVAAALLAAGAAHAQSAGTFVLSTGWFHLMPQSKSDPLRVTSIGGRSVNQVEAGTGASVNDANTVGLSGMYFITDHIATEITSGIAPKFKLYGTGTLAPFGQVGEVRQWSPTLLFKYYFMDANSTIRPSLGLGVSRVWFSGAKITNQQFEAAALHGPTTASADSSWAPVFTGGLTYRFDKHWSATASASYLLLSTTTRLSTTVQTPAGPAKVESQTHVKLNPIVTYLSVGYAF